MTRPYQHWLWVLFDTQGNILDCGRRVNQVGALVTLADEIEARHPGITVGTHTVSRVQTDNGTPVPLQLFWLAPDSQVADLSRVYTAKRADVPTPSICG